MHCSFQREQYTRAWLATPAQMSITQVHGKLTAGWPLAQVWNKIQTYNCGILKKCPNPSATEPHNWLTHSILKTKGLESSLFPI